MNNFENCIYNIDNVDLYAILDIPRDADSDIIKKQYRNLAKKYHPDKGGSNNLFALLTYAYNILSNDSLRLEYNRKFEIQDIEKKNHIKLKDSFMKSIDGLQHNNVDDAKKEFKKNNKNLDKKHNFNRKNINDKISSTDINKVIKELELSREQDDIECIKDPIFNNDNFNLNKFNVLFNENNKKEIIEYKDPIAYNNTHNETAIFTPCTYDSIYVENEDNFIGTTIYSAIQ